MIAQFCITMTYIVHKTKWILWECLFTQVSSQFLIQKKFKINPDRYDLLFGVKKLFLEKQSLLFSDNPYSTGWRCGEVTQENYKIGDVPYFQFLEDHVLEVWYLWCRIVFLKFVFNKTEFFKFCYDFKCKYFRRNQVFSEGIDWKIINHN